MIGQKQILSQIDIMVDKGLPRFIVIIGDKGCGKKTLANQIAKKLNYQLISCGIKVDEIRDIIDLSYKQTEPIIYLIPDADKMSIGAKNSLLKVIEEPPNKAYFIMTLQQIENTLETIKSRCQLITMENYSDEELNKFINEINPNIESSDRVIVLDCCRNKYQIDLFMRYGVKDFYGYVVKVVDNIYKVQSSNSFKLAEKLDIKSEGNGYDINLFFELYKSICMKRLLEIAEDENQQDLFKHYGNSISTTSYYQQKLNITGINKQSLIDLWILDIRKIWRE